MEPATWRLPIMRNMMRHQVPEWEIAAADTEKDDLQNFRYEDFGVVAAHHSVVPVPQTTAAAADTFPQLFEDLSIIIQTDEPTVLQMQTTPIDINVLSQKQILYDNPLDKGQSSGRIKTTSAHMEIKPVPGKSKQKQDERPRRSRSAELHNISERKRRSRIKGKMRALQELIPNCNKSDRASMLDDAIEYLKALKLQAHMMSMGGGAMCQASNLSLAGFQGTQIPNFMPYMAMGPGMGTSHRYGMGMINMCYSAGLPIIPVPSAASLHPLQSATVGLPLLSTPGVLRVPQLQMPFLASQVMPTAATTTSVVRPQFATDFSYTFNPANPGESSSQNNTKTAADIQKVPITSKNCNAKASHMVTPPSIGDSRVPKTLYFDSEAGCDNSR